MPPPGRPAPPASPRPTGAGQPTALTNPAVAARMRQLAAQAGHRRAIAEFHARRAADQQARINALLLEAIAALASLLGAARPLRQPPSLTARARAGPVSDAAARHTAHRRPVCLTARVTVKTCRNMNIER